MTAPRFSIVMLLPEARGMVERSVRSWTTAQHFARERFELVAVSDGNCPEVEARIPALLGASDRLLLYPGANRTALYDRGARAARGEFLIFTESHCVAEPSFLSVMDRFLQSSGLPGACCHTRPICPDVLSRVEARCCVEGLERYYRPDDWRKVNIHAFALRRDIYLEVGGMNPRYGIFAEMLLAAELWRRGHHAGVADAPPVAHRFDGGTRAACEYNRDVVAGEIRYYRDHPRGPRIDHTYLADGDLPWSERELARAAFAALWAERRRGYRTALRAGWEALKLTLREGRLGRAANRVTMALAAGACRVIGSKSALARRLFLRAWADAARLARKEYLATEPPDERRDCGDGSVRIDELPERDLGGFHLPESWQGQPLRWTRPCAVLRLARPARVCELTLLTHGVGWPVANRRCVFFADGQRVPDHDVSVERLRIRLRLPATANPGPMLLAVVCDPVPVEQGGTEPRELGFPLFAIETRTTQLAPLRAAA
jgi:hypothetical protein